MTHSLRFFPSIRRVVPLESVEPSEEGKPLYQRSWPRMDFLHKAISSVSLQLGVLHEICVGEMAGNEEEVGLPLQIMRTQARRKRPCLIIET